MDQVKFPINEKLSNWKQKKKIILDLPSGSLWVNNCISCALQNSCKDGGTTQQAARLICVIVGGILQSSYKAFKVSVSRSAMPNWQIYPLYKNFLNFIIIASSKIWNFYKKKFYHFTFSEFF